MKCMHPYNKKEEYEFICVCLCLFIYYYCFPFSFGCKHMPSYIPNLKAQVCGKCFNFKMQNTITPNHYVLINKILHVYF